MKIQTDLEKNCLNGLTKVQREVAINEIKRFEALGVAIPYGIIRTFVLKNYQCEN